MKDMKMTWKKTQEDTRAAKDIVSLVMDFAIVKGFSQQKRETIMAGNIDCTQYDVTMVLTKGKENTFHEFLSFWNQYFDNYNFPDQGKTALVFIEEAKEKYPTNITVLTSSGPVKVRGAF